MCRLRLARQQQTAVVHACILSVAADSELSGTAVHVLKYVRAKERYIILLQPGLGQAATKSLCAPASLVLAVGTAVVVSGDSECVCTYSGTRMVVTIVLGIPLR